MATREQKRLQEESDKFFEENGYRYERPYAEQQQLKQERETNLTNYLQNYWGATDTDPYGFMNIIANPYSGNVDWTVGDFLGKKGSEGYSIVSNWFNELVPNQDERFQFTPGLVEELHNEYFEEGKTYPWEVTESEAFDWKMSDQHGKALDWLRDYGPVQLDGVADLDERRSIYQKRKRLENAIHSGWDPFNNNIYGHEDMSLTVDDILGGGSDTVKSRYEEPDIPINEGELYQPYSGPDVSSLTELLGDKLNPVMSGVPQMTKQPQVESVSQAVSSENTKGKQLWEQTLSTVSADFLRP